MWFYIIGGVLALVLVLAAIAAYVIYRGYQKVKPKHVEGIPSPPFTHPILGHPDQMLHPLKHVYRLNVSNAARTPVHQLLVMNHASIFINDSTEAARVLETVPNKGKIYTAFRYDGTIPDILASDGGAFDRRKIALETSLNDLKLAPNQITEALMAAFDQYAVSGEAVDVKNLFTLLGFDCICLAAFNYNLGGVAGSAEGKQLVGCLKTLADAGASVGIYTNPDARKVPPEELAEAKANWKAFLIRVKDHIQSQPADEQNFGQCLLTMTKEITDLEMVTAVMIAEIHQVVRHAQESIAGTLCWLFYSLFKVNKIRLKLEKAIAEHSPTVELPYPEYMECVIKESFRRYPVSGNMTVRTASEPVDLIGGYTAPPEIPIHVHIFSMHNALRDWEKPELFDPERWLDGSRDEERPNSAYPKCPFLRSGSEVLANSDDIYNGVGRTSGSVCYLPFSAGNRSCMGKKFALQVIRKVFYDIAKQFRLNPAENFWEEDSGISHMATIVPQSSKSTNMKVSKIEVLGDSKLALVEAYADDGWADENGGEQDTE